MRTTASTEFDAAFKELPKCCRGFDPWYHKTCSDLAWLVLLQVDLYDENEDSEIKNMREYQQCKRYVAKWKRD